MLSVTAGSGVEFGNRSDCCLAGESEIWGVGDGAGIRAGGVGRGAGGGADPATCKTTGAQFNTYIVHIHLQCGASCDASTEGLTAQEISG